MNPITTVYIALGIFAIAFLLGSGILIRAATTLSADDRAKLTELQGQLFGQFAVIAAVFISLIGGWIVLVLRPRFISTLEFWSPFGFFGLVGVFLSTLGIIGNRYLGRMKAANLPQQTVTQFRVAFWFQLGGTFFMLVALIWFILRLRGVI